MSQATNEPPTIPHPLIESSESSAPAQVPVIAPAPAILYVSVPVPVIAPVEVCDEEANDGVGERQDNYDPEEWDILNNMEIDFDILSDEDSEDLKNDFDVRVWGIEYTPAMMKEFTNAD